jgi:hypothetical protein
VIARHDHLDYVLDRPEISVLEPKREGLSSRQRRSVRASSARYRGTMVHGPPLYADGRSASARSRKYDEPQ